MQSAVIEHSDTTVNQIADRIIQLLWPIVCQTICEFSAFKGSCCAIEIQNKGLLLCPNVLQPSICPIGILVWPVSDMREAARPNVLNKSSLVRLVQL